MKKILLSIAILAFAGCTNLTRLEELELRTLKGQGVSVDKPVGSWERPASPAGAALLNILPGFGNFYLASGNGGDSSHYLYGTLNLLAWPISVLWGVPEAAIDAKKINERELVYYYNYDEDGRLALKDAGLKFNDRGRVVRINK